MQRNLAKSILCCRHSRIILRSNRTQSRPCSSLSQPTFTSFFFHNAQWSGGSVNAPTKGSRASVADLAYQPPSFSNQPFSLSSYREIEAHTPRKLLKIYNQLAKSNLTILVVLTSMSGVALSPFPTTIPILLSTALGTVLCSASANTLNQLQEVPDGIAGPALLWTMTNPTTACLGLANIALYAGVYTWMKRRTIWNTWVGAVVGCIPPLMGWTACGGKLFPTSLDSISLLLPPFLTESAISTSALGLDVLMLDNPLAPFAFFLFLFSWQFFHFMPLSHIVRHSYAQAGYHMLAVLDPKKNALVALRHTMLLVPVCSVLFPLSGLTTWMFAVTTIVPNAICLRAAWKFWEKGGEKEARVLFQQSLWYLPVVMGLMMFHKQGMDWLEWIGLKEAPTTVNDALNAEENV
ncbi:hypothetical protein BDZ97DRAFT_1782521 [Flammula alnicola]|nr:hypothetical protein BDZ97DRAFT_1782521 [Flammula alnicola]